MSKLISKLSDELFDKYMQINPSETEMMEIELVKPSNEQLGKLLAQLNSINILLREQEYEYNMLSEQSEYKRINYKREAMSEGLKSTEAKEYSKQKITSETKQLIRLEYDINLLKDIKKSIENQLKYHFLLLSNNLKNDAPKPVELNNVDIDQQDLTKLNEYLNKTLLGGE